MPALDQINKSTHFRQSNISVLSAVISKFNKAICRECVTLIHVIEYLVRPTPFGKILLFSGVFNEVYKLLNILIKYDYRLGLYVINTDWEIFNSLGT
jgi:hypothetical protein